MSPHARARGRGPRGRSRAWELRWWTQPEDGREHARGRWAGYRTAQRIAAKQARAQARACSQLWELYLLQLSAILSPFVTTIQRWWRARANRKPRPRPAYAAMVVLRWWYHVEGEDEPLYSPWFQVDLNRWGHWIEPMVRTEPLTSFSLVTTYSQHREQARGPPTA